MLACLLGMRHWLASLPFVVLLTACPDRSPSDHASVDAAPPASDLGSTSLIDVPATDGAHASKFSLEAVGSGSSRVGSIALHGNVGHIELDGKSLPAFSYLLQPWEPVYTLYQTILVEDDAWYLLWLYCEDDKLTHLYFEGTNGTLLADEPATGSCASVQAATSIAVSLPSVSLEVEANHDFSIVGEKLSLGRDGRGTMTINARTYDVLPFGVVDCSACSADGWLELHSVFAPVEGGAAGTLIYYFFASKPHEIMATYGLELPSLKDPIGNRTFKADWSYDPPAARRLGPVPSKRWPLHPPTR